MRKLEITLDENTCNKIDEYVKFLSFTNQKYNKDIPLSDIDFINSAIYFYFEKVNYLMQLGDIPNELAKESKLKNKFKLYMKKIGMTQKEMSKKLNIDQGNLSQILNNKYQPSLDTFIKIWVLLNCPPIEDVLYRE